MSQVSPGWKKLFVTKILEEKGDFALEEERRLFMFILPELKKKYLSFAMKRAFHGDWMDALPSRFINEIPEENVGKNEILNNNDEFEFNQDNSIEFEGEYRSPGGIAIKIKCLNGKNKETKKNFKKRKIDVYNS